MSGSAYTYGYATLGELIAWIIGWDLVLEYAVGAIAVSVGWSGYVVSFFRDFGMQIPPEFSAARGTRLVEIPAALAAAIKTKAGWAALSAGMADQIKALGTDPMSLPHVTAVFNLPAVIIVAVVTLLLVIGIKESAGFNNVIVLLKLAVVLLFIVGAIRAINPANWHPFIPPNKGHLGEFGLSGVMEEEFGILRLHWFRRGESGGPTGKKSPRGTCRSALSVPCWFARCSTSLVSGIATGVVPYTQLDVPEPIATAADHASMGWMTE